jgi:hypothetical protein
MATWPCRNKWGTSNDERVLQNNVLPCNACGNMCNCHAQGLVAIRCPSIASHNEYSNKTYVATLGSGGNMCNCHVDIVVAIIAASIASHNDYGNKIYVATPRSSGNMCNCHVRIIVAIRSSRYCYADC